MMRKLLTISVLACVATGAPAKTINLATMSETGGYEISFCARPSPNGGKPGHAFVAFSKVTTPGNRQFLGIGHTLAAGTSATAATWSYFGSPVPGVLKEEVYTAIRQQCLTAKVNSADYNAAYALTQPPLQKMGITTVGGPVFEAYKLGDKDCMTFMISVAQILSYRGLVVPARGSVEFPMDYMQRLIASNGADYLK
ncbi:hypothetical protein [Sphingomonas sp. PP-CE-1G-424]|uniref:hypothetical protein n=1 Tax=Sphingomonas sp. PP-CE-1G-424 TaxID=2135658 RepID=UPI00105489BC|nr:hypothetical protein [Sphingomonas sp. PP-CE-1G-424]TCP67377.1 hypothetical protein C8J43_10317 [Sphingomonas sp. PP-CE-1G-424]